jgi:hypothetical protein
MPYKEDELGGETNSLQSIDLADERNMGMLAPGSDKHESSETADDVIESLCSESPWPQRIRINQKDRVVDSAVFHDSLAIRAGLIVVVAIALLGLAWVVRSSLSPSHLPSSPSVQIANSSASIPDSKGDRIQLRGNAVRETFGDASAEASPKHLSLSTINRTKPSLGSVPAGSSMIGHSTDLRQHTSSVRLNRKESDSERKLTPVPETRPTTIEGWTVREVTNGLAALEGPNGIWRVRRGDAVPGLGRIDSIVLWGRRWIVATSQSLISTP